MGSNRFVGLRRRLGALARLSLAVGIATAAHTADAAVAYVQGTFASPQAQQSSISAVYSGAQAAGHLNVVAIAWYDTTSQIVSVTDTAGNVYKLASGPTRQTDAGTQAIYYATNIASSVANNNRVVVNFNQSVYYPDLRISEYSGAATSSPVDVTAATAGSGTLASTASVTTANATDLLIGATYTSQYTTGPGTGYTKRLITGDGSIFEDRNVTATGTYNATAPISPSGGWIIQMVAFRAASSSTSTSGTGTTSGSGGTTTPPTAPSSLGATVRSSSEIDLSWGTSTSSVGIAQYLVERCQGAGCTSFAQIAAVTGTTYNNIGLTASTSYSYRVRAKDTAGNLGAYSSTASGTTSAATTTPPPPTSTLTISGTPPASVNAGASYSFTPTTSDYSGATLTFSITGQPSWATFNKSNGQLSGTPSTANVGTYSNIVISVTDGQTTKSLAAFSVTVNQVSIGSATLSWTPPTTNTNGTALTDLAGYHIYYGTSSTALTQTIAVANPGLTSYVVGNLASGTWYFDVKAYSSSGAESSASNMASKTIQ